MKNRKRILCAFLCVILLLSGCRKKEALQQTEPETTEATVPETTQAPALPVTQADGKPASLGCKNVYLADNISAGGAVGVMSGEILTSGQLQFLYALAVTSYDGEIAPDWSQPLFAQSCPLTQSDISWEQYFLSRAVQIWQVSTALTLSSKEPQIITEEAFTPNGELHEQNITPDYPQYDVLYADKDRYTMPKMHAQWVAAVPETLEKTAKALGYSDTASMAQALHTTVEAMTEAVRNINTAYSYYSQLYDDATPQSQTPGRDVEMAAFADIRQLLLIPDGSVTAADGTVTAEETAWTAAEAKGRELQQKWQKAFASNRYPDAMFGNLAYGNSMDAATALDGGSLNSVTAGQLIPVLDSWVFDPQRKTGDSQVLRTDYGVALVYIASFRTPEQEAARTVSIRNTVEIKINEILNWWDCQVDYSQISLASLPENTPALSDILYPDVGHEQYDSLPLYIQDDYGTVSFGSSTVNINGCGVTCLAVLGTYMSDHRITPGQTAVRYANYCVSGGTNADMYAQITPELDFYFEKSVFQWEPARQALEDGKRAVCLQFKGHFTTGGHYIVLDSLTGDGNVVVRDSALPHYGKLQGHKDGYFTPPQVYSAGMQYWLFSPKVVTIPACTRCGDGSCYALTSDYTCRRCLTALGRLGGFTQSVIG